MTLNSTKNEVKGKKCLYVDGDSNEEVRSGDCMDGGARSVSRVFRLESTYRADEYWIAPFSGGCWQPVYREGARPAETAADGVLIENVEDCKSDLRHWRFEPVDPTVRLGTR